MSGGAAAAAAVAVAASQAAGTETAVVSSLLAGSRVGSQFLSVAGDSVVDSIDYKSGGVLESGDSLVSLGCLA